MRVVSREDVAQPITPNPSPDIGDVLLELSCLSNTHPALGTLGDRLLTYYNWTGDLSPCILARAGFYHNGDDNLYCPACSLELPSSLLNASPISHHSFYKPHCPFITSFREMTVTEGHMIDLGTHGPVNEGRMTPPPTPTIIDAVPPPTSHRLLCQHTRCTVCLAEPLEVFLRPCGHAVTCRACAHLLDRCPICMAVIWVMTRIYLP